MRPAEAETTRGRITRVVRARPGKRDAGAGEAEIGERLGERTRRSIDRVALVPQRVSTGKVECKRVFGLLDVAIHAAEGLLEQETAHDRRRWVEVEIGLLVGGRVD